jgi:hypothetical protein
MSKQKNGHSKNRIADMSIVPEQRKRKTKTARKSKRKTAQMDHASSPKAKRRARDGMRKMQAQR